MNFKGQVVALVSDLTNNRLKAVSFTKGEQTVRVIKDFGNLPWWDVDTEDDEILAMESRLAIL